MFLQSSNGLTGLVQSTLVFVFSLLLVACESSGGSPGIELQKKTEQSAVSFTKAQSSTAESESLSLQVNLSEANDLKVSVDYEIDFATATAEDLDPGTATTGTLVFTPGKTTETITIELQNDDLYELNESIDIRLSNPVGAQLGDTSSHRAVITSEDPKPILRFSESNSSVTETDADQTHSITVNLSAPSGVDTSFDYRVDFGTSEQSADSGDLSPSNGTVTIPAGQTTGIISLTIAGDDVDESDEQAVLRLTAADHAELSGTTEHLLVIVNDDSPPVVPGTPVLAFASASSTTSESSTINLEVNLSPASELKVSVDYEIDFATATAEDLNPGTATSGTLVFTPGQTAKTITIWLKDDSLYELNESMDIRLSNPAGAQLGSISSHRAVITSDDLRPSLGFRESSSNITESDTNQTHSITVNLSAASGVDTSFDYQLGFGASDQSADSGDISPSNGTVTIPAGQTTGTISLTITGDDNSESTEQSLISIASATHATIAADANSHLLSIIDDDNSASQGPMVMSVEINEGHPVTARGSLRVRFQAESTNSNISHYYINHEVGDSHAPNAPDAAHTGWSSLASPAQSIDMSVDYTVGDASHDTYRNIYVYVWVKDSSADVSEATTAAYDQIKQTSPVLFTDTGDKTADPLIGYQWHLRNTGQANFGSDAGTPTIDLNLVKSFTEYGIKGHGVLVNVMDDGLELEHEDLRANIVPGSDDLRDGVGGDRDPTPSSYHGTSVAGLIAMRDSNGLGGVGVAPRVDLIAYNHTASGIAQNLLINNFNAAVSVGDVVNMSFGSFAGKVAIPYSSRDNALKDGLRDGRNDKGRIYVKAAGNGFRSRSGYDCTLANATGQSCQTASDDPVGTLPIINVGAVDASGVRASYSATSSAIWVSGLGGEPGYSNYAFNNLGPSWGTGTEMAMVTTDFQGCSAGYSREYEYTINGNNVDLETVPANVFTYYGLLEQQSWPPLSFNARPHSDNQNCNYAAEFNGTSAAAPTVSGVVALILEANPELTHWDVRHILASTARKIDPQYSVTISSTAGYLDYRLSPGWITNAAGYDFSDWYGFGLVDADAAVEMALNYDADDLIPKASVTTQTYSSTALNSNIPDHSTDGVSDTIAVADSGTVLAVNIRPKIFGPLRDINFSTNVTELYGGRDIQIELTSPSGTSYVAQGAANGHAQGSLRFHSIGSTRYRTYATLNGSQRLAVNAFYRETIQGNWTISVKDLFNETDGGKGDFDVDGVGGILIDWELDITYIPGSSNE